jgi:hypothetical protein
VGLIAFSVVIPDEAARAQVIERVRGAGILCEERDGATWIHPGDGVDVIV